MIVIHFNQTSMDEFNNKFSLHKFWISLKDRRNKKK